MNKYLFSILVLTAISLEAFDSKLEFRHRESEGVGYNQGYSTIEFIGNSNWDKLEFLTNVRGHVFNNGKMAGNVGLGLRKPLKSERYLLGLNAFYDVRSTHYLTAQQIGAGAEFLSKRADVRFNGYLPISKKSDYEQKTFTGFVDHTVYVKQKVHATLPCAEIELGFPIKSIFYLAGGPYYLFNKNVRGFHTGGTWGGRVRALIDITDYLSLSALCTRDDIFKTRFQGYISINIPLSKDKPKKPTKRNLRNVAITRNEIIPIETKHRTVTLSSIEESEDSLTSIIFVNNAFTGIGKGTFEEPFNSLKEAEKASQPGDVIYVFPGDGTTKNMDEGIILKQDQTFTSSAEPLQLDELVVPAQTPHQKPVITNIHPGEPIVSNGSYSDNAFTFIDPSDYIFPDWDTPCYDTSDSVSLLGGNDSGEVNPTFVDQAPTIHLDSDLGNGDGSVDSFEMVNHPDSDQDIESDNDSTADFEVVNQTDADIPDTTHAPSDTGGAGGDSSWWWSF